jgi:signal transduction histidine kinase
MVLSLSSGILALVTLMTTTNRVGAVTQHIVDDLSAVQTVRIRAEQLVVAARGYLLTDDASSYERLKTTERELERSLEALRGPNPDPELAAQLAEVQQTLLEYSHATVAAARDKQTRDSLPALEEAFEHRVEPYRTALDLAVTRLVELERGSIQDETNHAGILARGFGIALFAAWIVGIIISIVLGVVVMKRLNTQYAIVATAEAAASRAAASRKQVLDIVAHDLLSPLNAIVLGLEVMKLQQPEVPQAAPISRSAERMLRLVNDLLDASRAEEHRFTLDRQKHTCESLLSAVVEQFHDRAHQAKVELRVESEPGLEVCADRDRFLQIVSNFTGNALRVMKPGGTLTIAAARKGDRVRFTVTDTGPGIPAPQQAKLFDAYRQGNDHQRSGKLGLGLFISKALVEAHGGTIGVDSTVGVGSSFWFELPIDARAAA